VLVFFLRLLHSHLSFVLSAGQVHPRIPLPQVQRQSRKQSHPFPLRQILQMLMWRARTETIAEVDEVVLFCHKLHTSGTRCALPLVRPVLSCSEAGLGRTVGFIVTMISEGIGCLQCNRSYLPESLIPIASDHDLTVSFVATWSPYAINSMSLRLSTDARLLPTCQATERTSAKWSALTKKASIVHIQEQTSNGRQRVVKEMLCERLPLPSTLIAGRPPPPSARTPTMPDFQGRNGLRLLSLGAYSDLRSSN
jgi:hypothetical protein